jgi:glycosyltransferase involved in cell wall biosynthesis
MKLSELITIVIPCKNELNIIEQSLTLLNFQKNIKDVKVIIADSSDDNTTNMIKSRTNDLFNLKIIQGGLPSEARNNGSKETTTPYILFIDADMFILEQNLIQELLNDVIENDLDLITLKIRTTNGKYNYVFKSFDVIQNITKLISPFCVGGFMLFKKETFDKLKGFDESAIVAEDYLLSKQIKPSKFKISNKIIFTTPRRFEHKGVWYMVKLMVESFINRNNKNYFYNHKTYW